MLKLNFYGAFGLVTLSGCLWFLAVTPFDLSALAWVAAVPMLLAVERAPAFKQALILGWWAGGAVVGSGAGISGVLRGARHHLPAVHRNRLRHSVETPRAHDGACAHCHGQLRTRGAAIVSLRPVD